MPGRRPPRDEPRDEQPAARRGRGALAWALLLSLLINHALLLPVAHLALRRATVPVGDPTVELELAETPATPLRDRPPRPRPPRPRLPPRTVTLAQLPPQPPPPQPPPPQPPPPPEQRPPVEARAIPRLKMVETDTPETAQAPRDARFLSDKNRVVERETRARQAHHAKNRPRPRPLPAQPRAPQRAQPGEPRPRVAQTRSAPSRRRVQEERRRSPLMRMRQPPVAQQRPTPRPRPDTPQQLARDEQGELSLPRLPADEQRREAQPRPLRLGLDHRDYDRIQGAQAQRERELARLQPSRAPGRRHQRKWEKIRSALENFIPEVQPGNQTALGTRADPFAVYIARMHRQIHNYWGFGFLVDMDIKPDGEPMNDMGLWSMVEIVVKGDGDVDKATLVRSSGVLTYDAAALDTVYSAAPYPRPPRAIRSADGKVYLHWRFHRDQRQCGTFGVDPYILTKPPDGPIDGDRSEVGRAVARRAPERRLRRLQQRPGAPQAPRVPQAASPASAARSAAHHARAAERSRASPRDRGAHAALRRFTAAFAAGDAAEMAQASAIPFVSQGRAVARSRATLARLFGHLLAEASTRTVEDVALLSVAEARRRLGHLPRGVTWGHEKLVGLARLGGTPVTLVLARERGRWKVYGLDR